MFKRLFVLVLLALATVSISTPAHAATPSVAVYCEPSSSSTFFCYAIPSGGTPSYTFHWYEYHWSTGYFLVQQGSDNVYGSWCQTGTTFRIRVVVTDSTGAQGEAIKYNHCSGPY